MNKTKVEKIEHIVNESISTLKAISDHVNFEYPFILKHVAKELEKVIFSLKTITDECEHDKTERFTNGETYCYDCREMVIKKL